MATSPIDVACPNCQSRAGKPCTAPDGLGRHDVKRFHYARQDAARSQDETAPKAPPTDAEKALTETLTTLLNDPAVASLECEWCGWDPCDMGPVQPTSAKALLDHVAFDHVTRAGIVVRRVETVVSSRELGVLLRLPAQSEAEASWRRENRP